LRHCISINDLSKQDILKLLKLTEKYEKNHRQPNKLKSQVVASLFFEPSTRTRLSFESAIHNMGGRIIGFSDSGSTSTKKGESLEDTIRMAASYSDLIVMRHPENGSAARAATVSDVPVVNAGDGSNEHPTQTLLDLYSIQKTQGKLSGLKVGLSGDLKYSRTIHSLIKALAMFGKNDFVAISPDQIKLPSEYEDIIKSSGGTLESCTAFDEIDDLDILYNTRIQRERYDDADEIRQAINDLPCLRKANLKSVKSNFRVLSPLPRLDELDTDVDDHPSAYYFEQAKNGLFVRQALMDTLLLAN